MLLYRIQCSRCGHRLKYADEHVGRKAKCQKCRLSFDLPPPGAARNPVPDPSPPGPPPADPSFPDGEDIRTTCPHCAAGYEIPARYVGRRVRCQACEREFRIAVDHEAGIKELKRQLFGQLLKAAKAGSPDAKGYHMADAMGTLARLGDAAAAAAPDDPAARDAITTAAFEEAAARVQKVTVRRASEAAGEAVEGSIVCLVGGVLLVLAVGVVCLLTDVLFWGLGIIGILMILGGAAGTVFGLMAAVDAFTRRHPVLRAVTKGLAFAVGALVLLAALAFAGNAIAAYF